ncbi:tannase and feruloyl esterase [Colletotrichum salicis]|uniref:Carboxylic ester hydrolase n=1 Tax=Colletotrichum salicis TaxID=1209931 RepID=A0A135V9X4_9PEZI|nr:tannase and feruloyl esterase [Colletotrichum salicis]
MSALSCAPATFGNVSLFGAEILSLQTNLVTNYTISVPSSVRFTQPSIEVQNASFCNITVIYTHPGQGDIITFESWLPAEGWNGRLQAVGGGGWVAGRSDPFYNAMGGAVGDGYATITTDAGLGNSLDASSWALLSPGNVNLYNLQNLASVSLDDGAIIGKSLIKSYYGRGPDYSYWNGCSQGGRQGLMLAQRYPTQYDGIAAGAPGIQWTDFFPSMLWPQQFMNMIGQGVPLSIAAQWLSLLVARDPGYDLFNLSHVEFDWLAHQGRQRYNSIIGTDDPDLSAFRDAGGKLMTFHGLVDELLPPKGSVKYYNRVSDLIPEVHDFYRHFEVPGMGHCSGGRSGEPTSLFDQLRAWVENGTAPDHTPVKVTTPKGDVQDRVLCPYPQKAVVDPTCDRALGTQCWSCGGNL